MAGIDPGALWDFAGEITGKISLDKASAVGTVTRIDPDGTTWVSVGGSSEAPAASSIASVDVGDTVAVGWTGTQMTITGNSTDPPSSTTGLERLTDAVKTLREVADATRQKVRELTGYLWHDSSGIHIGRSDGTPDSIVLRGFNDYGDGNARIRIKDGSEIELAVVDTYQGTDNIIGALRLHFMNAYGMVLDAVFDTLYIPASSKYVTRADIQQAITRDYASVELHSSNTSAASVHTAYRSGAVVTVHISGLNLSAALADGSNVWVATVPEGYRPQQTAYAVLAGYRNNGSYVTVGTDGYVTVRNYSGSSIPTTRDLGATVTYCI